MTENNTKTSFSPEALKQDARKLLTGINNPKDNLFIAKTANKWMEDSKNKPIPRKLFSEFWYETDCTILFADSNVGKSILAVQLGQSIASGKSIPGFAMEAPAQKVIYFDFELNDKQFEVRYSNNYKDHFDFGDNFIRATLNYDHESELPFEEHLLKSMTALIHETGARVLIVDNITFLRNETEKASDALPLMRMLKQFKEKNNVTLLVLAHTPKRDPSKPLGMNDLQGSKMLMNFCDASFTIGASTQDTSIRYIKMIKVRNGENRYNDTNVAVCQLTKPDNFLKFEFMNYSFERDHLRLETQEERNELVNSVVELKKKEPAISTLSLSRKLCHDKSKLASFNVKISRILKRLEADGQL